MQDNNNGVTVALLAAHEADNLRVLLPLIIEQLKTLNVPYDIEVIDTAVPTDDTAAVCSDFKAEYFNQEFPGFGGAFKTAVKHASRENFLILDSDGSHNPKYIPDIYRKFKEDGCDVVIGSRYTKGGRTNDKASSIIMSRILNFIFRKAMGIKAHDISTNYRIYDTKQLKQIDLCCRNYDVEQEVLVKLKLNNKNLKIEEVPITFEQRLYGESKRQLLKFILGYIKTLFMLLNLRLKHALKIKI